MLLHELCMLLFVPPHIKGGVLVFLISPGQRPIAKKTGMAFGFFLPNFAIGYVDRDILFFDLEQNHMNKHERPFSFTLKPPNLGKATD